LRPQKGTKSTKIAFVVFVLFCGCSVFAQSTYKNPIIDADYSDPDVIRVGDDFYLTALVCSGNGMRIRLSKGHRSQSIAVGSD